MMKSWDLFSVSRLVSKPIPSFASLGLEGFRSRLESVVSRLNSPRIRLSKASVIQSVHCQSNLQEMKSQKKSSEKSEKIDIHEVWESRWRFVEIFNKTFCECEKFWSLGLGLGFFNEVSVSKFYHASVSKVTVSIPSLASGVRRKFSCGGFAFSGIW